MVQSGQASPKQTAAVGIESMLFRIILHRTLTTAVIRGLTQFKLRVLTDKMVRMAPTAQTELTVPTARMVLMVVTEIRYKLYICTIVKRHQAHQVNHRILADLRFRVDGLCFRVE